MSLLKIYAGQSLHTALADIVQPVTVTYQALLDPEPDTVTALAELQNLCPRLAVSYQTDPTALADHLIITSPPDRRFTFVGPPLGLELAALVSVIIILGRADSGLAPATRQALASLTTPAHLQLFTTPT